MPDTLRTSSPEQAEHTAVESALAKSSSAVAEIAFDPGFRAHLADSGISLDNPDPAEYWGAVADFTGTYLENHPDLSQLEKDSFAVVANLPAAVTQSFYLEKYKGQLPGAQYRAAKETLSTYNGLLRHYVQNYPQQSEAFAHSLLGATLETMGAESKDLTKHTETWLKDVFRGVKHEIGFSQILDELGVTYRPATVSEDLKGRDLVIMFNGHEIGVDVKASLSEVEAKNHGANGSPVARKPSGDLIVFSMLLEKDFEGGFAPDKRRVEEIAPAAGALLQKAILESIAK